MRIVLDPQRLDAEARRLDDVAEHLDRALDSVRAALESPGLPKWVGEANAIVADLERNRGQVKLAARRLAARSLLARLAEGEGMGFFGLRLLMMERSNPALFSDAVINTAQGMALTETTKNRGRFLAMWLADQFDGSSWRQGEWAVKLAEGRLIKPYSEFTFKQHHGGMTRAQVRQLLAMDAQAVRGRETALAAYRKLGVPRVGVGIGGGVDVFLQWVQDREDTFKPGHRAARITVTGAASVAAGAGVAAVCSTGVGCLLLAAGAGLAANVGAGAANDHFFASEETKADRAARERYERQLKELRKVEQWYIDNGRPSAGFMEDRLAGAETETRYVGGQTVTIFRRPGTDEILARRWEGADGSETFHVDTRGETVKP